MRKKGGKWPHLLSWKLASSENVFGARGWPVNGVNADEHNEGRGSANVPISSIRWSTTGSRLFFKSPSFGLLTSNSPCQQSLTGELMMFEWILHFVCFVSNFYSFLRWHFLSESHWIWFFKTCKMWESLLFLHSMAPSNDPQFSQASYLDISHYWDQGQSICNHYLLWGFPSPRRVLTLEKEVLLRAPADHKL